MDRKLFVFDVTELRSLAGMVTKRWAVKTGDATATADSVDASFGVPFRMSFESDVRTREIVPLQLITSLHYQIKA